MELVHPGCPRGEAHVDSVPCSVVSASTCLLLSPDTGSAWSPGRASTLSDVSHPTCLKHDFLTWLNVYMKIRPQIDSLELRVKGGQNLLYLQLFPFSGHLLFSGGTEKNLVCQ